MNVYHGTHFIHNLSVNSGAPYISYDTLAISVTANDSVYLNLGADNGCDLTDAQWYKDGVQTHSDTHPGINIFYDTLSGSGDYTCTFTFTDGAASGNFTVHIHISEITGIAEEQQATDLLIYPNPSHGLFTIEKTGDAQSATFKVYDLSGRLLYAVSPGSSSFTLDLSAYAPGIYIMLYENAAGLRRMRKLALD